MTVSESASTAEPTSREDLDYWFEEFKAMKSDEWGGKTEQSYNSDIKPFFSWIIENRHSIEDIGKREFKGFIRFLEKEGYKGHSITSIFYKVQSFLNDLVDQGVIEESPTEDIQISRNKTVRNVKNSSQRSKILRSQGDIHWIPPKKVDQLCDYADAIPGNPLRNELVIKTLFQTGVRRGELAEIRLDDINPDTNPPSMRTITLKNDNQNDREVYYEPSLQTDLDLWINGGIRDSINADSPYLFPTRQSDKISGYTINKIVTAAADAAGINSVAYTNQCGREMRAVTAHCLRHSFAVDAVRSDIDVKTLQEVMGHSDISTTQRYLDVIQSGIREKMVRFGRNRDSY